MIWTGRKRERERERVWDVNRGRCLSTPRRGAVKSADASVDDLKSSIMRAG